MHPPPLTQKLRLDKPAPGQVYEAPRGPRPSPDQGSLKYDAFSNMAVFICVRSRLLATFAGIFGRGFSHRFVVHDVVGRSSVAPPFPVAPKFGF